MFATLGHVVMKSFMLIWLYTSPNSWRGMPTPGPGSSVRVDGPQTRRILLCGSGIVVGYGVASHELALGGALARSLAARCGQGFEVETLTAPRLTTGEVSRQLTSEHTAERAAVVLSFGVFEALTFMPPKTWARNMETLVDTLLDRTPPDAQIFIVNCVPPKMSSFPVRYQQAIEAASVTYNSQIKSLASRHERVHYLRYSPVREEPDAIDGRQSYRVWADGLAPDIAAALC